MGSYKSYVRWPCVFRRPIIRDSVNPQLAALDPKVPFGAFQRAFREEHCSQLDPYGLGSCPYREEDCALAYYQCARKVLETPGVKSRVGLFRRIARASGAERADNKPLEREKLRTDGQGSSEPGAPRRDLEEGRSVRRDRPRSIASMFGEEDG